MWMWLVLQVFGHNQNITDWLTSPSLASPLIWLKIEKSVFAERVTLLHNVNSFLSYFLESISKENTRQRVTDNACLSSTVVEWTARTAESLPILCCGLKITFPDDILTPHLFMTYCSKNKQKTGTCVEAMKVLLVACCLRSALRTVRSSSCSCHVVMHLL